MNVRKFILEVAEKFRKARLEQGISLERMARQTGIAIETIEGLEAGEGRISADKLRLIADFLEMNLSKTMDECWMKQMGGPPDKRNE